MGEKAINQLFNVHEKYKKVNIINSYRFGTTVANYSDAAAIWSFRKVVTGSINSIRVRRSSDNTEQDIGFNGEYLDTSALTTFVGANDGFVVKIYDQSGNSKDFIQPTNSAQAKIVNSGSVLIDVDGFVYCEYDGVDDEHYVDNMIANNDTTIWVFAPIISNRFSIIKSTIGTSTDTWGWRFLDNSSVLFHGCVLQPSSSYSAFETSQPKPSLTTGTLIKGDKIKLFRNGVLRDESIIGTGDFRGADETVTMASNALGSYEVMRFRELILFKTDKSTEQSAIETDVNNYYSIY